MEINAVVKLPEAFQVFLPAYAAFQGVGELHFAEGDVVFLPGGEGEFRFFPENGEMAGIVCQPQVAFDKFGTAGTVAKAVEKTDGSIRIVKMAEGFRFQPQLHQAAGLPAQHIQESAHGVQPGKDAFFIRMKPAVRGRERADGQPVSLFVSNECQNAEQVAGVFKTFRRSPVRLENAFFHALPVEISVREPVKGFYARALVFQP